MSRIAAVSLLRQCTASVSAPAIARRSARSGLRPLAALNLRANSRLYSTQNGQNGSGPEEKKENGESTTASAEPKVEESSGNENASGAEAGAGAQAQGEAETQSGDAFAECEKKLRAREDEVVDLTSRLRYLQADFLNLQRNAAREREQTRDFAITRFAGDLLETVDVLSIALKSVPESALKPINGDATRAESAASSTSTSAAMSDSSSSTSPSPSSSPSSSQSAQAPKSASDYLRELHHGVEMTHRLLLQTLFKYGVKPFDPTGDAFDPNRHEALYQVPIPGKKPGVVVDCQKMGYTIKDRTLRAAQVGVASEASEPPKESGAESGNKETGTASESTTEKGSES